MWARSAQLVSGEWQGTDVEKGPGPYSWGLVLFQDYTWVHHTLCSLYYLLSNHRKMTAIVMVQNLFEKPTAAANSEWDIMWKRSLKV